MASSPLITAAALRSLLAQAQDGKGPVVRIFDCSFDLANIHAGKSAYLQAHIPGAIYASLEDDLTAAHGIDPSKKGAAAVVTTTGADAPASGGRHPLPNRERLAQWLSRAGFSNGMKAVVYDRNGSLYCGRLWWMLKWAGHADVQILDGGLQAWQRAGGAVAAGEEPAHFQGNFLLGNPLVTLVDAHGVAESLNRPGQAVLLDARAAPRYRGESEPLDALAGHIPGAINRPFGDNFQADGTFKSPAVLASEFEVLLGRPANKGTVTHYCGSGVSAIPNFVAMELAGLATGALYAGSWSDWSSALNRPVEKA